MGEVRLFQICYEGELTVEVSHVMRRLGAEPNFDQSWQVFLPEGRHAAPLVRYLRTQTAADARLLVACTQFTTARDFLLVRHSLTPGADYSELHDALERLGTVVALPFESTFVIQSLYATEMRTDSWYTTRPAPMFWWPTSLLPIVPSGRPTSNPLV